MVAARHISPAGSRSSGSCSTRYPGSVALRASIVIGARSRAFRFLVRLIERMPVLILPAWRDNRGMPIDERDIVAALVACRRRPARGRKRARRLRARSSSATGS